MGNFAQEGKFPSHCNGLFALEGLTFATGFPWTIKHPAMISAGLESFRLFR
jgi:hypothetical protein